jgi:hypothetical protein
LPYVPPVTAGSKLHMVVSDPKINRLLVSESIRL